MESREEHGTIKSYEDLIVWQKALDLAEEVYRATRQFPKDELYGLTSQMRRAAVSVASNIAEGHERHSRGEFLQFLGHARGSLAELETQARLAVRLGFVVSSVNEDLTAHSAEVGRLLNGLRNSLKRPSSS